MKEFEHEGKEYWESFGKGMDFAPRQYFDFVSARQYEALLGKYNLQNKKVIDLGAGYPPPATTSPEKELSPLASELQEALERKGAKVISIDVAMEALKQQKVQNREAILASAFQLPLESESVDGGAVAMNLLSSSFKGEGGKEVFMKLEECKKILQEVHRVLQPGTFAIFNNYGYPVVTLDNQIKVVGPDDDEVINSGMIQKLAEGAGFKRSENIPLDDERVKLGREFMLASFPEGLRERIALEIKGSAALLVEK